MRLSRASRLRRLPSARAIAESLGLPEHYAELLPPDKAAVISRLKNQGRVVAMLGDGVNDALSL